MFVRELTLKSFRNYEDLTLVPGEGLNVLVGENAQGKSNLLEAIHLLATTRSLRAGRESEMILHGAASSSVSAEVVRERDGDSLLQVDIYPGDKKAVSVNGGRRPRVIDLLGQVNAVFFGALDLGIVSGEPSVRRRFLNTEISQISPKYCFDLAAYKRVLDHRNKLLRDMRERPHRNSGLEVWNEQLVRHGAPLFEKRKFFIDRIAPLADESQRELTDGSETLCVRYLPSVPLPPDGGAEEIVKAFHREIERVGQDEMRRGTTLVGPQRDDLQFMIGEKDARPYGSQGQQRTVVLSLKLAEFRLIEDHLGEPPVLLLDDVMSDLDEHRRAHLLTWIRRRCQTFLTCTSAEAFPGNVMDEATAYVVTAGTVTGRRTVESRTSRRRK